MVVIGRYQGSVAVVLTLVLTGAARAITVRRGDEYAGESFLVSERETLSALYEIRFSADGTADQ